MLAAGAPATQPDSQAEAPVVFGDVGWEVGSSGSWSPVTAVVKATGTGDFAGELRLVPIATPQQRADALNRQRPANRRERLVGKPVVMLRGSVYRMPLALEAGTERKVSLMVPVGDIRYRADVFDLAGRSVVKGPELWPAPATLGTETQLRIGLLSDAPQAAEIAGAAAPAEVVRLAQRGGAGVDWSELRGFDVVIIGDFESARLDDVDRQVLSDFVALGGSLVVAGGEAGMRTTAGLADALVPLRPTGMTTASLGALAEFGGAPAPAPAVPVVTGEVRNGTVVVASAGSPLVIESNVGGGRVVQLAYDPLAMAVDGSGADPELRRLSLAVGLLRAADFPGRLIEPDREGDPLPPDELPAVAVDVLQEQAAWAAPPPLIVVLLLGYAFLVGPGLFFVLRARREAVVLWLAAPALTVAATAVLFGVMALAKNPLGVHQVSIERIAGSVSQVDAYHLVERRSGQGVLGVLPPGAQASVSPLPRPPGKPALPQLFGNLESVPEKALSHDTFPDGTTRVSADGTRVEIDALRDHDARIVRTISAARPDVRLEAHLRVRGGRLEGAVSNHGTIPVRRVQAHLPTGGQTELAPILPPGATVAVSAAFRPPLPAPSAPPSRSEVQREQAVLDAAARHVAREMIPAQVALVGLAAKPSGLRVDGAGRRSSSLGVVVTTTKIESADALNTEAGFGRSRLVYHYTHAPCCAPGPAQARVTWVYEIRLPAAPAESFTVHAISMPMSDPAIYDYESASWRRLDVARADPVRAGETRDGRILVRTSTASNQQAPPDVEVIPVGSPPASGR